VEDGCETSRLPHFIDNQRTDGVEVAAALTDAPSPRSRART
jgi:hypothetical protein